MKALSVAQAVLQLWNANDSCFSFPIPGSHGQKPPCHIYLLKFARFSFRYSNQRHSCDLHRPEPAISDSFLETANEKPARQHHTANTGRYSLTGWSQTQTEFYLCLTSDRWD